MLKNETMPKNVFPVTFVVCIIMINYVVLINAYLNMHICRYSTQRFKARKHSFGRGPK